MSLLRRCVVIVATVAFAVNAASGQQRDTVRVGIPERGNFQHMAFWVAEGAGLFKAEGLDIEVVVPDAPNQSGMILMQKRVDVSIIQPPVYLGLIHDEQPFKLFASLLSNEPTNLFVRSDVAAKLHLDPHAPLVDRLKAIKGLKLGIAPEPARRLRILYSSVGMDPDHDLQVTTTRADQTEVFASGAVDALLTHSPVLEDALVRLGAMLLVNQSAGEVAPLSGGQIHTLGATTEYIAAHPAVIERLTRAIARAQKIIHTDQAATIAALQKAGLTSPTPQHFEKIVSLYAPAVPQTPRVSAALVERNAQLYAARPTMPDFTKVKAADFVDGSFADRIK